MPRWFETLGHPTNLCACAYFELSGQEAGNMAAGHTAVRARLVVNGSYLDIGVK